MVRLGGVQDRLDEIMLRTPDVPNAKLIILNRIRASIAKAARGWLYELNHFKNHYKWQRSLGMKPIFEKMANYRSINDEEAQNLDDFFISVIDTEMIAYRLVISRGVRGLDSQNFSAPKDRGFSWDANDFENCFLTTKGDDDIDSERVESELVELKDHHLFLCKVTGFVLSE